MIDLYGYHMSVYSWIARMALREKGVDWRWIEVDPFEGTGPETYADIHPFGRVPALVDGDLALHETAAITTYVDEGFDGPPLRPEGARARARMVQVISIIDSYGYWPMVREVAVQSAFNPGRGVATDRDILAQGLAASGKVLAALDRLVGDGLAAPGEAVTLADLHTAPMVDYFARAREGAEMLAEHGALAHWFAGMQERAAFRETEPDLRQV